MLYIAKKVKIMLKSLIILTAEYAENLLKVRKAVNSRYLSFAFLCVLCVLCG